MKSGFGRSACQIAATAVSAVRFRFPDRVTAVVLTCAVVETAVLWVHPLSFWRNEGLSWLTRCSLALLVVLSWVAIGWLLHLYLAILFRACGGRCSKVRRWTFACAAAVPAIFLLNCYLGSWIFFARTGMFADIASLSFGFVNGRMLARYFWTAESAFVVKCAVGVVLTNIITLTIASRLMLQIYDSRVRRARAGVRCNGGRRKRTLLHSAVLFILFGESTWLMLEAADLPDHHSGSYQNQFEALLNPWPSHSFELRHHVNPSITILTELWSLPRSQPERIEIPQQLLQPRRLMSPGGGQELERRKSIILITVESLRSDVVFRHLQGQDVTPRINELAATGLFFPNCYTQSTQSEHSDTSILSSLYPLRSDRVRYYSAREPWPKMLPYDLLEPHGYSTAIFSSQDETWGNMHLFYESDTLDVFFDARTYRSTIRTIRDLNASPESMLRYEATGKVPDAITAQSAIDWMTSQLQAERPFFLHLNFQTSHFPYSRPDGRLGPFTPCVAPGSISLIGCDHNAAIPLRNSYYNALEYVDGQVGRVVDALVRNGARDQTIIAVTGDHGEAFCESTEFGHGQSPLETVTKVGLIINCPNSVIPNRDSYLVQSIDILPTILRIAGVPVHPALQGRDVLDNRRPELNERLGFICCRNPLMDTNAVISATGWKYVRDYLRETSVLHYRPTDLEQHPNLIDDEPEVAVVLHDVLHEWRRNQLEYYRNSAYYNWFYPPRAPELDESDLAVLKARAEARQ